MAGEIVEKIREKEKEGEELINKARADAKKIIEDAKKQAGEKIRFAESRAKSIIEEAQKKAEEQIKNLEKKYQSFIELEKKKRKIKLRENVYELVIDGVKKRLREMIEEPGYRDILKNWIIEAGIGLFEEKAILRSSESECKLIDEELLREAKNVLKEKFGLKIDIEVDRKNYIKGQGIILYSEDERRAFNNEVNTRILRKNREIQSIIYDSLLSKIE